MRIVYFHFATCSIEDFCVAVNPPKMEMEGLTALAACTWPHQLQLQWAVTCLACLRLQVDLQVDGFPLVDRANTKQLFVVIQINNNNK